MLSALLTVTIAFVSYGLFRFSTRISPTIPYAGDGSFFGRLKVPVAYGKDPVGFLTKQRQKLGDVFCVDLFLLRLIFFLGPEGTKTVLHAGEEDLSFWEGVRSFIGPNAGLMLDEPEWMERGNKAIHSGLTKPERLEDYVYECQHIPEEHFEKWTHKDSVPLFESFSSLIFGCLFTILLGEDFRRKHADEVTPIMAQFERDLSHPLLRLLPWRFWGLSAPGARILGAYARMGTLIDADVRDIFDNPEQHRGRTDYLYYVCEHNGRAWAHFYSTHVTTVVFGGHANMAMTLPWMFLHARRTPGALDTWRREAADAAAATGTGPARRPFLEACLREAGRLYTNASIMRRTKTRIAVGAHTLPAGAFVACSPAAAARDAALFGADAGAWRPERFLADGAHTSWFRRREFVQFGAGLHACPGEKLARLLVFDYIVPTWMEKYEIEVVSGLREGEIGVNGVGVEAAWTEHNFGTPSVRGQDVQIRVTKRLAPAATV